MKKKNFDELPEKKIDTGIVKPKSASEDLEKYFGTLGDGTKTMLGIETGLKQLDNATLGLDGVIVLGGIAGKGKTSLALQLAFDACEKGTPVIFYSLEMPKRAIYTKILNRLSKIRFSDILLKGKLFLSETGQATLAGFKPTDENITDFNNAIERLKKVSSKLYIRSREREEEEINFESVEQEVQLIRAEHKAEKVLVVIDHLQVFNVDNAKDQIDKEGKLINGFKGISERTGATTLLISQKNKSGFNSKGMQTIKGSVDIIYLADIVMTLEGEEEKENPEADLLATFGGNIIKPIDLIISKNRYNAPTKITLDFNGACSDFAERDK